MTHNFPVNFQLIKFQLWTNFETFKCSGENFPNSKIFEIFKCSVKICYILYVSFQLVLSYFASFFIVKTHNSPVNFKLIHFLLGMNVPHKSPNFESQLSSTLVKICQIPHVTFRTKSQLFFKFCITLQCHKRQLLCTFLGQTLYTFHGRDLSKCEFLRLLSALIKINQILVIFETTNQFFFQFSVNKQCHETQLLCTFLAEILYVLSLKGAYQGPNLVKSKD